MKNIPSFIYDRIENNNKNSFFKICFFDGEKLQEIARWRNSYNAASGANYGLLQMWTSLYNVSFYETQGGRNTCGGYNKPIANLEGCLYQFQKAIENELVNDCGPFKFSYCGSIESLLETLKNYLQKQFEKKLFLVCCNG